MFCTSWFSGPKTLQPSTEKHVHQVKEELREEVRTWEECKEHVEWKQIIELREHDRWENTLA